MLSHREAAKQLCISPSHSILTLCWPVPVLTLWWQVPGRVVTGVPIFKSLVWLDPEKIYGTSWNRSQVFCSPGKHLNHCSSKAVPLWPHKSNSYGSFGNIMRQGHRVLLENEPCSLFLVSVSAQDGIIALGKAHSRSAPSLSSLPKVALETVPICSWLNTLLLPFFTPLSFRRSMLWCSGLSMLR